MSSVSANVKTSDHIYSSIAKRSAGDIYIGVVGPVRTGKSTFIKQFMKTMVIPHMEDGYQKDRALDELPQSASGRTIMTTEPKFIPEEGALIHSADASKIKVRMIDCVGYVVPSAFGYIEDEQPRLVQTPWFDHPVPFNMAAEIGTKKVITEHSTIGIVVTTDGSLADIPLSEYEQAESRVIAELKELGKPFVVLLNCVDPDTKTVEALAKEKSQRYEVPVIPVNCLRLSKEQLTAILNLVLYEFPVRQVSVRMPHWVMSLPKEHWLKSAVIDSIMAGAKGLKKLHEVENLLPKLSACEYIKQASTEEIDPSIGKATLSLYLPDDLFYRIIGETTGFAVKDESMLLPLLCEMAAIQKEYQKLTDALKQVEQTGYGIVMPSMEELELAKPQIVKQGGKYGGKLKASAPSIHMMRADITTEVSPIVGSERQSEELIRYLMEEFEEDPHKIWQSNIFGKSLHELVNEGLHHKLSKMPQDARHKLQETIERIINEGCSGLICFIL